MTFAWTQGALHGPALAMLAVCMALGLELAKPFAIEGVFASLRSWSVGRALAMLALGLVAIAYSLTAELSLMAMSRGDMAASRARVADTTKGARAELQRVVAERAALPSTPSTGETVTAAREAVAAAERTRKVECEGGRGPRCRAREADEGTARAMLAKAVADKAATDRAAKLDSRADALRARLAQAPATAAADPGAAALAAYLGIFGLSVPAGLLAQWLVLVGVIALETGSALAVVLVHAASGAQRRVVEAVQDLPAPVLPEQENAAPELPAAPEKAPASKNRRGRPPRERKAAAKVILRQVKANGGELAEGSVRKLAKAGRVRKSTVHSALAGLIASGVLVKTAAGIALA